MSGVLAVVLCRLFVTCAGVAVGIPEAGAILATRTHTGPRRRLGALASASPGWAQTGSQILRNRDSGATIHLRACYKR